jgi:hypothetical protein
MPRVDRDCRLSTALRVEHLTLLGQEFVGQERLLSANRCTSCARDFCSSTSNSNGWPRRRGRRRSRWLYSFIHILPMTTV